MTLDQLKALLEVSRLGSVSAAARALHISQPAVSQQIRALEEHCQEKLLDRIGRQVQLTESGRVLEKHARLVFEQLEVARCEMQDISVLEQGELRIACSDTISRFILLDALSSFSKAYPNIQLCLHDYTSNEVIQAVEDLKADIGIALLPISSTRVHVEHVYSYKEVLVCGKTHALANRKTIHLSELSNHSLLGLEGETKSSELLALDFAKAELSPESSMSVGSVESQILYAAKGFGVAIVPEFTLNHSKRKTNLIQIQLKGTKQRKLALLHTKGRELNAAMQAFRERLISRLSDQIRFCN